MAASGERQPEADQEHHIVMEEHYDEGPDYCKLVQHYTITYTALFIGLVAYVCIGAGVFQALEYPQEKTIYRVEYQGYVDKRNEFLSQMWNVTESYGDEKAEWLEQALKALRRHEMATGTFVRPPGRREIKWTFAGALFFSCTVISTIGYGNLAPVTVGGRVFCMIYAVFGIAMLLLVLASIGSLFARGATLTYRLLHMNIAMAKGAPPPKKKKKLRAVRVPAPAEGASAEGVQLAEKKTNGSTDQRPSMDEVVKDIWSEEPTIDQGDLPPMRVMTLKENRSGDGPGSAKRDNAGTSDNDEEDESDQVDIPLTIVLIFALMYVCMLAGLLCLWEDQWNYFEAFYFSFVTLTTIGFGDLVPQHQKNLLGCTFFILLGMAIMSMCIALAQEIITKKVVWISEKVGVALIKAKPT